jgi:hypothetical protein
MKLQCAKEALATLDRVVAAKSTLLVFTNVLQEAARATACVW